MRQIIVRKGTFDAAHRVMNERMKCFNIHGHTYLYEIHFRFHSIESIGYNIDFKEIKRIGCQWIDDMLDHAIILNPKDSSLINISKELNSKYWVMSLNGEEYCNPTAENISKEIFLAMMVLFGERKHLVIDKVILYETPNCFVECTSDSFTIEEMVYFLAIREDILKEYSQEKGVVEYDNRKKS